MSESRWGARDVPMPGTCHPAYARHEDMIRRWLHGELDYGFRDEFRIPKLPRIKPNWAAEGEDKPLTSVPLETLDLRRQRCTAPAPYVGEPYVLLWDVAVDQYGRTVAGLTYYKHLLDGTMDAGVEESFREARRESHEDDAEVLREYLDDLSDREW